jgi:hypothetical protein
MLDDYRQCDWGNPAFRRQYQRDYRKNLKRQGYRRLDAWIDPKLWEALYPLMDPECRDTHPTRRSSTCWKGLFLNKVGGNRMRSKAHKPRLDHPWITGDRLAILRHRERKALRKNRPENRGVSILVQFQIADGCLVVDAGISTEWSRHP